jgi:hypothetical protein
MAATFLLQYKKSTKEVEADSDITLGTATGTKTREEPDQDFSVLGTKTLTEVREEADQDRGNSSYLAIPLGG